MKLSSLKAALTGLALSSLLTTFAFAQTATRGTWTAEVKADRPDAIQLEMQQASKHSNFGHDFKLADLPGLQASALNGSNVPVSFTLARDAGTVSFSGTFNKGLGHGEFTFAPSADYVAGMKQLGYADVQDKQFELAMIDVSRAYVKELKGLGFNPDLKELISARIFNVNREQVESLRALGVKDPSLQTLVQYRIFKVDADYVSAMRKSFPNLSMDKLVEMRIHNATPEYAKEMAALGYSNLDADKLVQFRIHGVTPEYIKELRQLGLNNLSADQLVQFRIFGVGRSQLEDLAKEGYTGLSPDNLVAFRIHGVDSKFIAKVKKAGYSHPSPDQLVNFKIMGIRHNDNEI